MFSIESASHGIVLIVTFRRIGAVILRATFGYTVADDAVNDVFLNLGLTTIKNFSLAVAPGTWLVDVLPQREP